MEGTPPHPRLAVQPPCGNQAVSLADWPSLLWRAPCPSTTLPVLRSTPPSYSWPAARLQLDGQEVLVGRA